MRACVALGAALVALLGSAALASGQTNAPAVPARLLLLSPLPAGVEARITGQTADLPWQLQRVAGRAGEDRLQVAAQAARASQARAALWVTREDNGAYTLRLYDPRKHRLLERRFELDPAAGALADSAALEALALAVRSALRALAADQTVGEAVAAGAGSDEAGGGGTGAGAGAGKGTGTGGGTGTGTGAGAGKGAGKGAHGGTISSAGGGTGTSEGAGTGEDGGGGEGSAVPAGRRVALAASGGWDLALDGQSPLQQGPWARLGVALGRVELAAEAQTALAVTLRDPQTRITLRRHVLLGGASLDVVRRARVQLALGAAAGVAAFARKTTRVDAGLQPAPAHTPLAFALGLALRARFVLLSGARASFGFELALGALVVPAAPVLRYDNARDHVDRALWLIQPHAHLGPYLRLKL